MFLAGQAPWKEEGLYEDVFSRSSIYILESFYYADEWIEKHIPFFKDFLLDSGAYTFFSCKHNNTNWEEYVDRYADFINRNKVNHFFELDIDKLIGYENVLKLRERLELKTGKQCIPVWHKSRGKEDFIKICEEYKYVAIGGLVGAGGAGTSAYSKELTKYFPWFINEAHKNGTKIHALGYTSLEGLTKYHFDSVDSTSWTTGNRFGCIHKFDGRTIKTYSRKKGQRLRDSKAVALNNFMEWVKFQQYADIAL